MDVRGRGLKAFDDFGLEDWNARRSDDGLLNCLKVLEETAKGLLNTKDMLEVSFKGRVMVKQLRWNDSERRKMYRRQ